MDQVPVSIPNVQCKDKSRLRQIVERSRFVLGDLQSPTSEEEAARAYRATSGRCSESSPLFAANFWDNVQDRLDDGEYRVDAQV
mmetsp:Transcript_6174/g.12368  ORF Transcript_6174/g.12368 Transcript_6174/m.12368 type:complete len:84 (-) Transcript_6174:1300-1551(-)